MSTTAVDALVIVSAALDADEQQEALERMTEVRARREAGEMSDAGRVVHSLRRVADLVGYPPSPDEYRQARDELVAGGENIESFTRVSRHFGSWRRAKEALALSETTTARRIEVRFRFRRGGKVWRYDEQVLGDTLKRCANHYGARRSRPSSSGGATASSNSRVLRATTHGTCRARRHNVGAGAPGRRLSCTSALRRTSFAERLEQF